MNKCKQHNTEDVNSMNFCRSCGKILIEGQKTTERIHSNNSDFALGDGTKIFLEILCFIDIIVFGSPLGAESISRHY